MFRFDILITVIFLNITTNFNCCEKNVIVVDLYSYIRHRRSVGRSVGRSNMPGASTCWPGDPHYHLCPTKLDRRLKKSQLIIYKANDASCTRIWA